MHEKAKYYIDKLKLESHPEGGYFKEVYRSIEKINTDCLPARYGGERAFATSIYFMLEGTQISALHKLRSDEIWHFYDGTAVKIYMIDENGKLSNVVVGGNMENGGVFQFVIKKNNWFGAELLDKNSFCLVGCTVAPGFDFTDFELGTKEGLLRNFPSHNYIINKLVR